ENIFFLIRMVDRPEKDLPFKNHALLLGKPSNDWRKEMEILTKHKISHIVCRNSGGPGAYAKIEAARHLGIEVIIVTR
ncbi:MAG: precorrin-6A/cobalt-precorrin-6A reductase, partial [Pseudomonadota bacterium]